MKKYLFLILASFQFFGCATLKLIETTSSITETPTSLVDARYFDDKVVLIYKSDLLNESTREVQFTSNASLFVLPKEQIDKTIIGEKIDLDIDSFLENKPLKNNEFTISKSEHLQIVDEEHCFDRKISNMICGKYPKAFRICILDHENAKWYNGIIRERLVKEKQPITRIALFPFALATDIVLSPIYLVGGTAIMLYAGSAGHK